MAEPTPEELARARRVATLRRAAGLSQVELASACSVSRSAVAQWEGAHASPSADVLAALAAALKTTADALLAMPSDDEIAAAAEALAS